MVWAPWWVSVWGVELASWWGSAAAPSWVWSEGDGWARALAGLSVFLCANEKVCIFSGAR